MYISVKIQRFQNGCSFLQVWFDKDIFKGIDDDENLEDADVEAAITAIKKKGGKVMEKQPASAAAAANGKSKKRQREEESGYTSDEGDDDDDDDDDSDSDYDMEQMRKTAKSNGNYQSK